MNRILCKINKERQPRQSANSRAFRAEWLDESRNKGITLVEIIVSMLILAIIIVPLLSSFVTAGKANLAVKNNSFARTVGESVIESVKLLGIEGTALEFYKDTESAETFIMAAECSGFGEIVPVGGHESVVTNNGIKKFSPQASGIYEYMITGVKQGTGTYDVKLKLDKNAYPNDYQYADLSAFASDKTALVNPALRNSDYDYKALQYFKQLHERYLYSKYVTIRDQIEAENGEKWEQYYEELDRYNEEISQGHEAVKPELPQTKPIPDREEALPDEYIKNNIKKTLDISIKEKVEGGNTIYIVDSTMTYECDNTLRQFAATNDVIVKTYSGYCSDQGYADIESLLVMYAPFSGIDTLNLETVNIKKETLRDIDVYIIVQSDRDVSASGSALNVNVDTAATGSINLYSQASLDVTPATISSERKLIHDVADSADTIYNIDVEVYEAGGTFSSLITSIKSTLVNR